MFISLEVRTFLSLSLIVFWLTAFPLRGFLASSVEWCQVFLIIHSATYLSIYFLFDFFKRYLTSKLIYALIVKMSFLTMLFPFTSNVMVKIAIGAILGIVSSFIVFEILKKFKRLKINIGYIQVLS